MSALLDEAQPSPVRGWLAGRSKPSGARAERLIELAELTRRFGRAEAIPVWLNRPVIALDDEKPIELIPRGGYKRIARLIAEIEYPSPQGDDDLRPAASAARRRSPIRLLVWTFRLATAH